MLELAYAGSQELTLCICPQRQVQWHRVGKPQISHGWIMSPGETGILIYIMAFPSWRTVLFIKYLLAYHQTKIIIRSKWFTRKNKPQQRL